MLRTASRFPKVRAGIEVFYPFDNEPHVTTRDGHLVLEGDFGHV